MAHPTISVITDVRKEVWPVVAQALVDSTHRIADLAGLDDVAFAEIELFVARAGDGRPRRRQICSETIWTMARMGRLRTGGETALIDAVRAYFDTDPDDEAACAVTETALLRAFQALPDHDFDKKEITS